MSFFQAFQALVLGIVQGLTEFLPISSSGHLFLTTEVLGWPDPSAGFTAVIQIGTVAAVLIYFWNDLLATARSWFASLKGRGEPWRARLGWAILVGTIPIVILGLALEKMIDRDFRHALVVASTLIILALVLAWAEKAGRRTRKLQDVTIKDGLWVGLWQAVALVPGSSRSGCTITGGLFLGFERATAARLSFLLSVPSVLGSGLYKLVKDADQLGSTSHGSLGWGPTILATLTAFATGYMAIAFLMKFLQTRSTHVFIWYRIVLGLIILGWFFLMHR